MLLFAPRLFYLISQDLTKLWTGQVACHKHNARCEVRQAKGTILWVSSKDLARSNPKRWLLHGNVFASTTSPGKTADTFKGFVKLLDSPVGGSPAWAVLEKSDPLLDESDGNAEWETMREALGIRGFKTRPILVDSVYFRVPMHRRRSNLVCRVFVALIGRVLSFEEWPYVFDDLLAKCRRNPPCLSEVLSKPGKKHIEHSFNQLTDSEFQKFSFRFQVSDSDFYILRFTCFNTFRFFRYIEHNLRFR